jgi:hypothetical protein
VKFLFVPGTGLQFQTRGRGAGAESCAAQMECRVLGAFSVNDMFVPVLRAIVSSQHAAGRSILSCWRPRVEPV